WRTIGRERPVAAGSMASAAMRRTSAGSRKRPATWFTIPTISPTGRSA
ncbi:MAG: hypothetical protein AVDCRST_MAG89-510, partial [uncultured Gemmatimonadetes bacterium]